MAGLKKKYTKEDLTIVWQPDLCIHSKICFKGLSHVFNPANKPWVNMDAESNEEIKNQVDKCPSGALSYVMADKDETTDNNAMDLILDISENGPILIKGPVNIKYKGRNEINKSKTIALCRCGESANKPFCDGSHRKSGFTG